VSFTPRFLFGRLFGLLVLGVLFAEAAVLGKLKAVGIVFLVFHRVVIALLAFGAGKGNFDAHIGKPPAAAVNPAADELKVGLPPTAEDLC
jgi:hypothetical protein